MKCIRKIKQIFALLLAAVMMVAMAVPAMADEGSGSNVDISEHTFEAYQIFTGDYDDGKLLNIQWGNGVASAYIANKNAAEVAEKLSTNALNANTFASEVAGSLNVENKIFGTGSVTLPAAGYYLIIDTTNVNGTNDARNLDLLEVNVAGTVTPRVKTDKPTLEKKVKDTNDIDGSHTNWQDSADYDIGDKVPFKLEGTVAENYADYKGAYKFVFHDKEEAGLTFDKSTVKVYVDGTEITSGYAVKTSKITDECTFEVEFPNLRNIESVKAGSKIRVEYESELNTNAALGNRGNVNKAKLEFSNNPNAEQGHETTGETPWDNVIVFTYKITVNKYANEVKDENKLTGAEFTLEKIFKDGTKKEIAVVKSDDGTSFTFKGLDDGKYVLSETKTPEKYNKIDPIEFTVTADHNIVWESEERTGILTSLSGNVATGEITFTAESDKTGLTTNVINKSGAVLPSTGGIGTRIFYVVGGILMVSAAILLIVKRRMSKEN